MYDDRIYKQNIDKTGRYYSTLLCSRFLSVAALILSPSFNIAIMASTTQDAPPTTTPPATTTTTSSNVINIGTRRSKLAMIQAEMVVEMLKESDPRYEYNITAISTMGDKNQVTALHDFGAKSLWTFELETMLLNGEVDLIVHCLKGTSQMPLPLPSLASNFQTKPN